MPPSAADIRRFTPYWQSSIPELRRLTDEFPEASFLISIDNPWAEDYARWNQSLAKMERESCTKTVEGAEHLTDSVAKMRSAQCPGNAAHTYLGACIAEQKHLKELATKSRGLVFALLQPRFSGHKSRLGLDPSLFVFGRNSRTAIADFVIASSDTVTVSHAHFGIGIDSEGFFFQRLSPRSVRVNGIDVGGEPGVLGLNPHQPNILEMGNIKIEVMCCYRRELPMPILPSGISKDFDTQTQSTVFIPTLASPTNQKKDLWIYPHQLREPDKSVAFDPWSRQEYLVARHGSQEFGKIEAAIDCLRDLQAHDEYMVPTRATTIDQYAVSLTPLRVDIISLYDLSRDLGAAGFSANIARKLFWCLLKSIRKLHTFSITHGGLSMKNVYVQTTSYSFEGQLKVFIGGFYNTHSSHSREGSQADCCDIFKIIEEVLSQSHQSSGTNRCCGQLGHTKADTLLSQFRHSSRKPWTHTLEGICNVLDITSDQILDIWSSVVVSKDFKFEIRNGVVLASQAEAFLLYQIRKLDFEHVSRALNERKSGDEIKLDDLASVVGHLRRKFNIPFLTIQPLFQGHRQRHVTLAAAQNVPYHPRHQIFNLDRLVILFDREERRSLLHICDSLYEVRGDEQLEGTYIPRSTFDTIVSQFALHVTGVDLERPSRRGKVGTLPGWYLLAENESTELRKCRNIFQAQIKPAQQLKNILFPCSQEPQDSTTTYRASTPDSYTSSVNATRFRFSKNMNGQQCRHRSRTCSPKREVVADSKSEFSSTGTTEMTSKPCSSESRRGAIVPSHFKSLPGDAPRTGSGPLRLQQGGKHGNDLKRVSEMDEIRCIGIHSSDRQFFDSWLEDQATSKRTRTA